jgi:hypothetical protein
MGKITETILGTLTKLAPKNDDKFKEEVLPDDVVELRNTDEPEADAFSIGQLSWGIDFEIRAKTTYDLITMYRQSTVNFEIDDAIDEIVNEAIVKDGDNIVDINLDNVELSDSIKKKIKDAYDEIIVLLNFNNIGDQIFRKWYTDGRIYFQIITEKSEKKGIKRLQPLSPFDIIRLKIDQKAKKFAAVHQQELEGDYCYIWKENEQRRLDGCADVRNLSKFNYQEDEKGYLISEASIAFVPSGITDYSGRTFISPLHKSLKPLNQLRLLEDAAVIYRITRAPERRVFFIDVGKLPKKKADAYVKKLINGFKSKIYYNASTGQLSTKKNILSMIQDYYLPTNADQKGTKVETLEGGKKLGEVRDILYFKKKLYKSLKVPLERIDDEDQQPGMINIGNSGEMSRKELKFTKFIQSLQYKFSLLFMDLLEKQLIHKKVMAKKDWVEIKNDIIFQWSQDNYYAELKDAELLRDQAETAESIGEYVGKYFSNQYVQKNIFKMTDDQIKEEEAQIKKEEASGEEFVGDDIKDQRQADIDATAPPEEEEPGEGEEPAAPEPKKKEEPKEKKVEPDKKQEPPVKKEEKKEIPKK